MKLLKSKSAFTESSSYLLKKKETREEICRGDPQLVSDFGLCSLSLAQEILLKLHRLFFSLLKDHFSSNLN